MKEKLKKIPIIGFLVRWINNLIHINNIKFRVIHLQEQNNSLTSEIAALQEQNKALKREMDFIKNSIESAVAKEIFYQSLALQERVDQFIFDANIELKTKISKDA